MCGKRSIYALNYVCPLFSVMVQLLMIPFCLQMNTFCWLIKYEYVCVFFPSLLQMNLMCGVKPLYHHQHINMNSMGNKMLLYLLFCFYPLIIAHFKWSYKQTNERHTHEIFTVMKKKTTKTTKILIENYKYYCATSYNVNNWIYDANKAMHDINIVP